MAGTYSKAALVNARIAPTWTDGATISFIGSDNTLLATIDVNSNVQIVTGTLQFVRIEGSSRDVNGTFAFAQTLQDNAGNLLPVNSVEITSFIKNFNMITFTGQNPDVDVSSTLIQVQQVQKPRWDMTTGDDWERKVVFAGHLLHASLVSGRLEAYSSLLSTDAIVDRAKKSAKKLSKKTANELQQ
jgi:hypothetical protein